MLDYQVLEDNGGGLHLFVFEGEEQNVIFAHSDYEYHSNSLIEDIAELKKGGHPIHDGWDGCVNPDECGCEDLEEYYNSVRYYNGLYEKGLPVVADEDGIYPERMEGNALDAFGIEIEE